MEWAVLFSTIVLSAVAIGATIRYGRAAGERLEQMKTIMSRMDKEVLEEIRGILEEIRGKVKHLVAVSPKHNKPKHEHK